MKSKKINTWEAKILLKSLFKRNIEAIKEMDKRLNEFDIESVFDKYYKDLYITTYSIEACNRSAWSKKREGVETEKKENNVVEFPLVRLDDGYNLHFD